MVLIKILLLKLNNNNSNNNYQIFQNKQIHKHNKKQHKYQLNKILNQKMLHYYYFIQQVILELLQERFLHQKYFKIL
jgi:hypothetical protein